jgi:hypothetical protein
MRRSLAALAALTALAGLPAAANAKIIEIGETQTAAVPSCPGSPCLAVSRTTGYQVKTGDNRGFMQVPAKGMIVAWTIGLSKPSNAQIKFFNDGYGGEAQAGLTVLEFGDKLTHTVKAATPIVALKSYFGSFAQFPLAKPIRVEKGDQLALTIPTWAPSLQVGLAGDTSWRASRNDKKCKDFKTQTAQMNVGDKARYLCLYRTARLAYSATLVTFPKQVNKPKAKKSIRDSR